MFNAENGPLFTRSMVVNTLAKSFVSPTNAQLICFKILKFTLKCTINAPTCFGLVKSKHVGAFIVHFDVNFNILKQC